MDDRDDCSVVARRVRYAVAELDGIAVLPSVAAQVFARLSQSSFSGADVVEVIEASPALTWLILSVSHETGIHPQQLDYRIERIVNRIPLRVLYQHLLRIRAYDVLPSECEGPQAVILERSDLVQHSVAVACAARRLAQVLEGPVSEHLAYLAGMLHDMGKFALLQALPKGYARIVGTAQAQSLSLATQERSQLGVDHAAVGAYLARRWHLPSCLQRVIWLHHGAGQAPGGKSKDWMLASLVQVANGMVHSMGLGDSGNCHWTWDLEAAAQQLQLDPAVLVAVQEYLSDDTQEVSQALGLAMEQPQRQVGECLQRLAIDLEQQQARAQQENRHLKSETAPLEFIQALIVACDRSMNALDVAAVCAQQWQRYFQTGKVCLFLYPTPEATLREVVWVDELAQVNKVILDQNLDDLIECAPFGVAAELLPAYDWEPLFDEIETEFDLERTRTLVCYAGSHPVAALAFELQSPDQTRTLLDGLYQAAPVVGTLVAMAQASEASLDIIEALRDWGTSGPASVSDTPDSQPDVKTEPETSPNTPLVSEGCSDLLEGIAEMAAGMAHELNNPLSVISGRAQLLAGSVQDEEARQDLQQIQAHTEEVARVVESLMGFAEPAPPQASLCAISGIITDAVDLARVKVTPVAADLQVLCPDPAPQVWGDSAMLASALANIITNALEAYEGKPGTVTVEVEPASTDEPLVLRVVDQGCGMDAETLRKAVYPFFSAKPAGRKRGMGLAYAQRILQLNGVRLMLQSAVSQGTTVTLTLPTSAPTTLNG